MEEKKARRHFTAPPLRDEDLLSFARRSGLLDLPLPPQLGGSIASLNRPPVGKLASYEATNRIRPSPGPDSVAQGPERDTSILDDPAQDLGRDSAILENHAQGQGGYSVEDEAIANDIEDQSGFDVFDDDTFMDAMRSTSVFGPHVDDVNLLDAPLTEVIDSDIEAESLPLNEEYAMMDWKTSKQMVKTD
ncbi:hypothetical protein PC121_g4299 [Phytophthora cactorum]|nr:hypothetical protein PC120_g5227 [Phytophthora cactorum]KAG3089550.1 hypothetical protein PC121_g4299 [Phytophthora cactorum]